MRKVIDRGLSRAISMDGTEREQTHGQNGSNQLYRLLNWHRLAEINKAVPRATWSQSPFL